MLVAVDRDLKNTEVRPPLPSPPNRQTDRQTHTHTHTRDKWRGQEGAEEMTVQPPEVWNSEKAAFCFVLYCLFFWFFGFFFFFFFGIEKVCWDLRGHPSSECFPHEYTGQVVSEYKKNSVSPGIK